MAFRLLFTTAPPLILSLLLASSLADGVCDASYSCGTCGAGCHWCAAKLRVGTDSSPPLMGKCIAEAENCNQVKFGDLADILTFALPEGVVDGVTETAFTVTEVPSGDVTCTNDAYPPSLASATCDECTAREFTWCSADLTILSGFTKSGGVCIPPGFKPLCEQTLIPENPYVSAAMKVFSTRAQCASNTPATQTAAPSATCSSNYSCKNCGNSGSSCTWCGLTENLAPTITASAFGVCLDGVNDCSAVTGYNMRVYGQIGATLTPIAGTDDTCNTVEWPRSLQAETCSECVGLGSSVAWCRFAGVPVPSGSPAAAPGQIPNNPGICVDKSLGFLCAISGQVPDLQSQLLTSCAVNAPTVTPVPPPVPIPITTPQPVNPSESSTSGALSVRSAPVAVPIAAAVGMAAALLAA